MMCVPIEIGAPKHRFLQTRHFWTLTRLLMRLKNYERLNLIDMTCKERSSNFELFRLLLMFLIVFHHGIIFGLGFGSFSTMLNEELLINKDTIPYYAVLNAFCIVGVNCFVLLSGFFAIKPSVEKVKLLIFRYFFI